MKVILFLVVKTFADLHSVFLFCEWRGRSYATGVQHAVRCSDELLMDLWIYGSVNKLDISAGCTDCRPVVLIWY